jgi:membrane-bound inhibitor of C-type lysozyme
MQGRIFMAFLGAAAVVTGATPAPAQKLTTYDCRDGAQFVVAFYEGDQAAHVQLDGKTMRLAKRLSASGSRYVKGDVTLRMTTTGVTLKRRKKTTQCTAR